MKKEIFDAMLSAYDLTTEQKKCKKNSFYIYLHFPLN